MADDLNPQSPPCPAAPPRGDWFLRQLKVDVFTSAEGSAFLRGLQRPGQILELQQETGDWFLRQCLGGLVLQVGRLGHVDEAVQKPLDLTGDFRIIMAGDAQALEGRCHTVGDAPGQDLAGSRADSPRRGEPEQGGQGQVLQRRKSRFQLGRFHRLDTSFWGPPCLGLSRTNRGVRP